MSITHAFQVIWSRDEMRTLSIVASVVFLIDFAIYAVHMVLDWPGPPLQFVGLAGLPLLFAPLVIACASMVRLAYLRFAAKARVPFVDGWLVHLSIVALYTGPYILAQFFNLLDSL